MDIAYVSFMFPLIILCKYSYASLTDQPYVFIGADYLDLLIVILVLWALEVF